MDVVFVNDDWQVRMPVAHREVVPLALQNEHGTEGFFQLITRKGSILRSGHDMTH